MRRKAALHAAVEARRRFKMKRVCVMGILCGRGNELAPEYPAIAVNAFGAPLSVGSGWGRHGTPSPPRGKARGRLPIHPHPIATH